MNGIESSKKFHLLLALTLGVGAISGCAVAQLGASDADLEQARSQAVQGASLFEQQCATCHGARGQGIGAAPAIMGIGALPRYPRTDTVDQYATRSGAQQQGPMRAPTAELGRPEFISALSLHEYLVYHMPKVKQGERLSTDEYWAVLSFMLLAHGVDIPKDGVGEENASNVKLAERRQ